MAEKIKGQIPIRAGEQLSKQYGCPMVVIFALHPGLESFTVTTYGETKKLCRVAASYGDRIAEAVLNGEIRVAEVEPTHWPDRPDTPAAFSGRTRGS